MKLCLLCNFQDDSGAATCVMCGEATWMLVEQPQPDGSTAEEPEAPAVAEQPKKRGRK
jgi:hypothetical protein